MYSNVVFKYYSISYYSIKAIFQNLIIRLYEYYIYTYKQFCFIYEEFIIKLLNLLKFIKYKSTENVYNI